MVQLQRVLGVPLAADADSAWPVGAVPRPLHRAFALTLAAALMLLLAACGAPSAFVLATASPLAAPAPAASRMAAEAPVDSRIVTAAAALVSQDVAPTTSGQSAADSAADADPPEATTLPQAGTLAAREEADRLAPGQMLQASPNPLPAPKPEAVTWVPILMYHYIRDVPASSPDKLGYGLSVAPKLFDQQ
ncbi:MAG TPA: hypothetical protein VFS62_15685, partial [Chloroflexota bacterium]|nr:hypothetical protein [Chloroflexota bacterium]